MESSRILKISFLIIIVIMGCAGNLKTLPPRTSSVIVPAIWLTDTFKRSIETPATIVNVKDWTRFETQIRSTSVEEENISLGFLTTEKAGRKKMNQYTWDIIDFVPKEATFNISFKNISQRILSYRGVTLTLSINDKEIRTERKEIGNIERCIPNDEVTVSHTISSDYLIEGFRIKIGVYDIPAEVDKNTGDFTKLENGSFDFYVESRTVKYTSNVQSKVIYK